MARTYTLKRRAESQAETRKRIVKAAIELHAEIGPARTTVSDIASRAGVQRHTVYAHFPDDRAMLMACSELDLTIHPAPDPAPWREIGDRRRRIETGLGAIYAWFAGNATMFASIVRDAEFHRPTQEIVTVRFAPLIGGFVGALGENLGPRQMALLRLAIGFHTFRTLTAEAGLAAEDAAALMAAAIDGAESPSAPD